MLRDVLKVNKWHGRWWWWWWLNWCGSEWRVLDCAGCWCSGRMSGREAAWWRVDETHRPRHGRDRLLHVSSSLGPALCRQSVRRRRRQLHRSASVKPVALIHGSHSQIRQSKFRIFQDFFSTITPEKHDLLCWPTTTVYVILKIWKHGIQCTFRTECCFKKSANNLVITYSINLREITLKNTDSTTWFFRKTLTKFMTSSWLFQHLCPISRLFRTRGNPVIITAGFS